MLVGVLSFCAYWNFVSFHFGNYFHVWDTFHYYVGSKYFKELSYDRLYECVAVADSEDPSLRRRVELRKIMNLRTNMMESTSDILAHPEACKKHFTPRALGRLQARRRLLPRQHGVKRWEEAQTDHGYNATPVWNIVGSPLANSGPATDSQIFWLTRIDPFFIIGMSLMTWWAFGWRVLCVALAVFATNFPTLLLDGRRVPALGLAVLLRGRRVPREEGEAAPGRVVPGLLGAAARVPALPLSGPRWWSSAAVGRAVARAPVVEAGAASPDRPRPRRATRAPSSRAATLQALLARIDRRYLSLFAGLALVFATLVPISLVTSNGIAGYRAFFYNTQKHNKTPLTNYMGLKTVVDLQPVRGGPRLKNEEHEIRGATWKRRSSRRSSGAVPVLPAARALAFVCCSRAPARRRAVDGAQRWARCSWRSSSS